MKFLKVGFSNSTRMSISLNAFCSPRAYEPKRPILLTANLALISPAWLLRRSIIFMFILWRDGFPMLKALLFCISSEASLAPAPRQPRRSRPACERRRRAWVAAGRAGWLALAREHLPTAMKLAFPGRLGSFQDHQHGGEKVIADLNLIHSFSSLILDWN